MFCPIERVELRVDYCPAKSCAYKDANKACAHEMLTSDDVSVNEIADARAMKVYKVKAESNRARDSIAKGMVILKYAGYIQDSFPNTSMSESENYVQTVNEGEDHVLEVLQNVFGLSEYQQNKFWDSQRYATWAARNNIAFGLEDLKAVMHTVTVPNTP